MSLPNEIVLRPRFQEVLSCPPGYALKHLEQSAGPPLKALRVDDHIFFRFSGPYQHFWSPQLQLEILEEGRKACRVYGLFGPNPTLWTFFIFLHFGVGTLFIIAGIWAYSSASLGHPYSVQLWLMVVTVVLWFALYAFGRAGRAKGKPQMQQLYLFYRKAIDDLPQH